MTDLFAALLLLSLVGVVLALIRPKLAMPWSAAPNRKKAAGLWAALAVACFVGVGVTNDRPKPVQQAAAPAAQAEQPAKPEPAATAKTEPVQTLEERIKAVSKKVSIAKVKDGAILVQYDLTDAWSAKHYLFDVADASTRFLKIAREFGQDEKSLVVAATAELKDKYGNTSRDQVLALAFSMAEVRKINFANLTVGEVLNFAEAKHTPVGRDLVMAYCADDDWRKQARAFCAKAMAR